MSGANLVMRLDSMRALPNAIPLAPPSTSPGLPLLSPRGYLPGGSVHDYGAVIGEKLLESLGPSWNSTVVTITPQVEERQSA